MSYKDNYEYYLNEVIRRMINMSKDVKQRKDSEFQKGILHGIYMCVSILYSEAEPLGLWEDLNDDLVNYKEEEILPKSSKKE